jgi:UDP-N-acetylmuramoyl-tripeptide--D-alanyl-D-alanine ligase
VKKAKGELYDYLRDNQGTAFVMWDYDELRDMSKGIPKIIRYGSTDGDITGSISQDEPFLAIDMTKGVVMEKIQTQLVGDYNLPNILSAITIGNYFQVPAEKIRQAIESYTPSNSRSQLVTRGSNRIILDAYNANPSSMTAAIENFARTHAENKILILGAMAELGKESMKEHEKIISLIGKYPWKQVVLVGGDFVKLNPPVTVFENSLQAKDWFQQVDFHDSYFLIKGSRSMQMEKLLEP